MSNCGSGGITSRFGAEELEEGRYSVADSNGRRYNKTPDNMSPDKVCLRRKESILAHRVKLTHKAL